MACVTKYAVVESHSAGKFSLRENIYIMFSGCLYNRIVAAVMCVCWGMCGIIPSG